MHNPSKQNTFVVRLLNTQHKTWQGTLTWLDTNRTQPFRSLLEMLTLMDSAAEPAGPADDAIEAED